MARRWSSCVKLSVLGLGLSTCMLSGCDQASEEDLASLGVDEGDSLGSISQAILTGPTLHFQSYAYASTNNNTERYADCNIDQVMSGFGARVTGDNFTDLTVYCRDILSNGGLSAFESVHRHGGASEERNVHVDNGHVILAAGATVTNDNVFRLVVRQCPWIAATKRVDVFNCSWKSSLNESVFAVEKLLDVQNGDRQVATGIGLTSSNDNVATVRMSNGLLK